MPLALVLVLDSLSLHWGDVVPAWAAVVVTAICGVQAWLSSRRSKTSNNAAKIAEAAATAQAERAERATPGR